MSKECSLSNVWRKSGIKKILFFTYSFNFYWFHNQILPRIRNKANKDSEIIIIASENDNMDFLTNKNFGNQYGIENWCEWQTRLKIFYLPRNPMFHSKFIITYYDDSVEVGLGSANLTPSGWSSNLELWDWNQQSQIGNILQVLNLLVDTKKISKNVLENYIKDLGSYAKGRKNIHPWLLSKQQKKDVIIFNDIKKLLKAIEHIRIVSPYYGGTDKVLEDLVKCFGDIEFEIWFDGSKMHSKQKDLEHIKNLMSKFKIKAIKYIQISHLNGKTETIIPKPLHAKLIEFITKDGSGQRVFGSANATYSAWYDTNIESIVLEAFNRGEDFESLVKNISGLSIKSISLKDLSEMMKKITSSNIDPENEQLSVLWGTYDEMDSEIRIQFKNPKKLKFKSFRIESNYDLERDIDTSDKAVEERETLLSIAKKFNTLSLWTSVYADDSEQLILKTSQMDTPETITVQAQFEDIAISCYIIPVSPDFSYRDKVTGIPKMQQKVTDLFSGSMPIVRPITPRPILDAGDDIDEEEETSEGGDDSIILSTLTTSPEYNYLPEAIKIIHKLQQSSGGIDKAEVIRKLKRFLGQNKSDEQHFLAKTLLEVLND